MSNRNYKKKSFVHSEVEVRTGSGYGSTNTTIRRFGATPSIKVGNAISYSDSAANGALFTINEPGLYAIEIQDEGTGGNYIGVSKNSSQLTTSIISITDDDIVLVSQQNGALRNASVIRRLKAGDLIRPHYNDQAADGATSDSRMRIMKIGD